MLGRRYKTIAQARWYCCRGHSEDKMLYKHSIKRLRAREKAAWRRVEL